MIKRHLILLSIFLAVMVVIILILLMSGPRMRTQPSIKSFEMKMPDPPDNVVYFNHRKFDPSSLVLPDATEENLKRGGAYYDYYCTFCHGEDGRGNGEVGMSYHPKPADLTSDSIPMYSAERLYYACFTGTGHSPVLERVVPYAHRPYILAYILRKLNRRGGLNPIAETIN
jgi:hypothetical protein